MNLMIQETWIDRTRNVSCGKSDVYETKHSDIKTLFKSLMSEYGRCISKVYIDEGKAIGWYFRSDAGMMIVMSLL